MNAQIDLIIVRGAPGTGKSSLGRKLKKYFAEGVLIEMDNLRGMMNIVNWESEKQHLIALDAAASLANSFLDSETFPVIVVDMFMPDKINNFLEKLKTKNFVIVSLLAADAILEKRLSDRNEGFKDLSKAIQLNKSIKENLLSREIIIDSSSLDKTQVLEVYLEKCKTI